MRTKVVTGRYVVCIVRGRTDINADKFPEPQSPNFPIQRTAPPSAMQIWRRTFATSVGRLSQSSAINSPSIVRCAKILQASKNGGVCSFEDQEIKVNGFVRSVRKQKRFAFAEISDGSTVEPIQAILKPAQAAEYVRPRVAITLVLLRLTQAFPI